MCRKEKLILESMKAIKDLDSGELGIYLDHLYIYLNNNFKQYEEIIEHATCRLEHDNMTDEEIEIQDDKIIMTNSLINRPRSFFELTWDEQTDYINIPKTDNIKRMEFLTSIIRK
jgi:hypothetical protein